MAQLSDFKVGDKIRFTHHNGCCSARYNEEYLVQRDSTNGSFGVGSNPSDLCSCYQHWELIKSNSGLSDKLNLSSLTALAVLGFLGYAVYRKEKKHGERTNSGKVGA